MGLDLPVDAVCFLQGLLLEQAGEAEAWNERLSMHPQMARHAEVVVENVFLQFPQQAGRTFPGLGLAWLRTDIAHNVRSEVQICKADLKTKFSQ